MLDAISNILVAIANGAYTLVSGLVDMKVLLVLASLASLAWLAAVEIEQLDRRGYKPGVRAH